MRRVITIRCKGGPTDFEKQQMAALKKQEELQEQLTAIDLEFYEMRQQNKAQYEQDFRPMEEDLLRRARQPAREATSAAARAGEYEAADTASAEALARRRERFGIAGQQTEDVGDEVIRSIALTAVGNVSKMSALETNRNLGQAALGIGTGINQDIGRTFGRAIGGMQQGLGHADAAFANFAQAQQHQNQATLAKQQGYGALIQTGTAVAGMGISNYQQAQSLVAGGAGGQATWQSAFSAAPTNPSAGNLYGTPL
jgi:hypothetical protein